jgi:hypothetical protein
MPEQLVQQIHDSPTRIVLAATGGGSRAIADLLEVPGGSRTLLEAVVPYSAPAMIAWLGGMPDEFCSARAGRAMAMAAFHRARRYEATNISAASLPFGEGPGEAEDRPQEQPSQLAGVACTASLATDRPKRGEHRIHIALQTASLTAAWRLQLQKGRRTREEEERLTGRMLLNVVAEASDVAERLTLDLLEGERIEESRTQAQPAWQDLLLGKVETIRVGEGDKTSKLLFPGAFNPLHDGHRRMIQLAQEMLKQPAALEISIVNVDKPPLDYMEIERRLAQFPNDQPVLLSRAATFEDKSRLFAGATFVVGVDTLRRIAAPQYYGNSVSACECAIQRIAGRGCRFLVFGRNMGTGFIRLGDLDLPDLLRALCREVPSEIFREDVSSTTIRKSGVW